MSAELTVRIDGTVPISGGAGVALTTQAGPPRVVPAAAMLSGSGTITDSVTPVLLITIPVGKTFIGVVNVIANSRATTAAYATVAATVAGGGTSTPAQATVLALAGSSRDAGACPVNMPVQVTATAGTVTIVITASTATTFNGSGLAVGELV